MFKQIKYGLINRPLITVWKLTLFPALIVAALTFASLLVIFNLGLSEAKDFIGDVL